MYIKSNENIYVFQLLSGTASGVASGGYNYIPPLSCFLPKKIDEIALVDENEGNIDGSFSVTRPTKLNIITAKGSTLEVKRNGVSIPVNAQNGPFNVTGSTDWVTYSFPNVSGNIAVSSTDAVTAGISAGNGAVGYGGFFAGFFPVPAVLKVEGECLPGVTLEVTGGFDIDRTYKWVIKNINGIYDPAPGENDKYQYTPQQAGIYAAIVKQGICPEIQTQDYKFYNCTTYTNNDVNSCGNEVFTPNFTLSSQTVNPATVNLATPPTKGTVTISPSGQVSYTANPDASGTDTFKISFCGIGAIPDCETIQYSIHMIEKRDDIVLQECSPIPSEATYNLSLANVSPDTDLDPPTYFKTQDGAQNNIPSQQILNFTNYTSADGFIYVRLVNSIGCIAVAKVELTAKLAPEVKENLYTKLHCDEDVDGVIDGTYKVNLNTITPIVLVQPSNFVVKYYTTQDFANADGTNNITGTYSFTGNTSVWIRVDAPNGCQTVIKEILLKVGTKLTINDPVSKVVCDNDHNNSEQVNLASYIPLFTTATVPTPKYFATLADAQNNTPTIPATQTITGNKTFYYRLTDGASCEAIGTLNLIFKNGTPSTTLQPSYTVCQGSTATLNVGTLPDGSQYPGILWNDGDNSAIRNLGAGTYFVDLTDKDGCTYRHTITVIESPKPVWNIAAYNATHCDDNFDGIIPVNLNTVTPVIIGNAAGFTVHYYLNQDDAIAGNNNYIQNPAAWSYSANTTLYVNAFSQYCPGEVKQIDFKFGTNFPLLTATASDNVCSSSNTVNLNSYSNLFTSDGTVPKFFATLQNAQNNTPTIGATQTITADKTFYFRYSKRGFCDVIGTLNLIYKLATPTALLNSYTVCQGSSITLNAEGSPTYTAWLWKKGATVVSTTSQATLNAGVYTVAFTNASGCVFTKTITVVDSPKPILNIAAYNASVCDSNFDGTSDPINFNSVTPIIVTNYAGNAALFNIRYYLNQSDRDAGNNNTIPNLTNWTFTVPTTVYVRAETQYCTYIADEIHFNFGTSISLITAADTRTVCDTDLNGSEVVNLASYRTIFTTDGTTSVKYFDDLVKAQNNLPGQNIPASQTISAEKTFYYRFSKSGLCDVIGTLNILFKSPTPTALLNSYTVCQGSSITLNAEGSPTYTTWLWKKGATVVSTTSQATLNAGVYTVAFTNGSGCVFTKTITVVDSPKPLWNTASFNIVKCDEDFDGQIPVDLEILKTSLITNASLFDIRYYTNPTDAGLGNNNYIQNPATWTYSTNTTLHVRAVSQYCPAEIKQVNFKFGTYLPLITSVASDTVCDSDLSDSENIKLVSYKNLFTLDNTVAVKYFDDPVKAQQNLPNTDIPSNQTISGNKTFYYRFSKAGFCDVIGTLNLSFKQPRTSSDLKDKQICPETFTELDTGADFDGYLWSTGATTRILTNVGIGEYFVDLKSNGCVYRQHVIVSALPLPTITGVEIQGTTVTITASGGIAPYKYAIDNFNWQDSNVFHNVRGGDHTAYVISADNCAPVSFEFNVMETYNSITPNGDGINDTLNYSGLLKKEEPFMQIFDRHGKLLFTGDNSNKFIWNGTAFGKVVTTGTYWYVVRWKEPGAQNVIQQNGWIFVKNRE
ncbi:gliding motility-associated C-terminal domain-containing protein [Chryseobacterium suipulveris]|uniref:Gliding motility-associated C-terminal domain-containing protein n=1 Tax=Chryseobacterium suipulveris TaxID=2929800 RepID=A0ABY4BR20_9FLAO|nr:T9SS type B sorting domain-containing protein [Chryseobacterium suipulveris]UOE41648.1 gliding motility-associated C-terminal domain-containing protein [Chryseobacterium suipulveris]